MDSFWIDVEALSQESTKNDYFSRNTRPGVTSPSFRAKYGGMRISTAFSDKTRPYTGPELRPHFLLTELGVKGHGIGAFVGPCDVKTESLVDYEDRLAKDHIRAELMLHFLGEFFDIGLQEGVLLQRLFMATAGQAISEEFGVSLRRDGDDLFFGDRKLSVSIVTASPVSKLLHVGINIDSSGAPVKAAGLLDLGLKSSELTERVKRLSLTILQSFKDELESVEWACAKVRPVV